MATATVRSTACLVPANQRGLRQVIAVANDITHNSGAFGPREDAVFRAATELALAERLPLVYLAANSGARVGLAAEVKACLQARAGVSSLTLTACTMYAVSERQWLLRCAWLANALQGLGCPPVDEGV